MGGFEVLFWTIPILFTLALLFAILLWCRGWRREEGQEMDRRLKLLTEQVTKLAGAVEQLQKAQTAARTAEGRLSEQMTALFASVSRFLSAPPSPASPPGDKSPGYISPASSASSPGDKSPGYISSTSSTSHSGDKSPGHDSSPPDRYDRAREMLASGADPVEVARALDISLGDVHVLQRLLNLKPRE